MVEAASPASGARHSQALAAALADNDFSRQLAAQVMCAGHEAAVQAHVFRCLGAAVPYFLSVIGPDSFFVANAPRTAAEIASMPRSTYGADEAFRAVQVALAPDRRAAASGSVLVSLGGPTSRNIATLFSVVHHDYACRNRTVDLLPVRTALKDQLPHDAQKKFLDLMLDPAPQLAALEARCGAAASLLGYGGLAFAPEGELDAANRRLFFLLAIPLVASLGDPQRPNPLHTVLLGPHCTRALTRSWTSCRFSWSTVGIAADCLTM